MSRNEQGMAWMGAAAGALGMRLFYHHEPTFVAAMPVVLCAAVGLWKLFR